MPVTSVQADQLISAMNDLYQLQFVAFACVVLALGWIGGGLR